MTNAQFFLLMSAVTLNTAECAHGRWYRVLFLCLTVLWLGLFFVDVVGGARW